MSFFLRFAAVIFQSSAAREAAAAFTNLK